MVTQRGAWSWGQVKEQAERIDGPHFHFILGFPSHKGAKAVFGSVSPPVMDEGSSLGNIALNQHTQPSLSIAPSEAARAEPC